MLLILTVIVSELNDHVFILVLHVINDVLLLIILILPGSSRIRLSFMLLKNPLGPLSHLLLISFLDSLLNHVKRRLILIGSSCS